MTVRSANPRFGFALAAAALVFGAAILPNRAAANTIEDVAVALRSGDNVAACRAFEQYESDTAQFNGSYAPAVAQQILQGQSAKYWYDAAQASNDHALRCVDLFRAEFAERKLQTTPDYDQTTFNELRNEALQEYGSLPGKLVLAPTAPSMNAEGSARYEFVYHHQSQGGLPTSCQANWSNSGMMSQHCAQDLFAQAEIERKTGNCPAASIDYKNARTAADNAGLLSGLQMQITSGLMECQAH